MRKFSFFDFELESSSIGHFLLNSNETYHLKNVLRLKEGASVEIYNGKGLKGHGVINNLKNERAIIEIDKIVTFPILKPSITLGVSPVKNRDRIEWVVEKAVELGVNEICFFTSKNSERTKLNFKRIEKISISAIKQSGNPFLPEIKPLFTLEELIISTASYSVQKLIADCNVDSDNTLIKSIKKGKDILVLIGPEGGFENEEIERASRAGFIRVSLGENTLRAETAAIFSISVIKANIK
jgi:16S rRNA (uracil1498-N3)-methyltransferase